MSRNQKIIVAVVVAVLVVTGVVIWALSGNKSKSNSNAVVIYSRVQRRTLQNTVALTGTLARKQLRNITASTQGIVSAVHASNGSVGKAGQSLFALNGRPALAETGTVAFFRSLEVGDQGDDVTQLKKILAAAGDYPGPMNNQFTLQTQFALAEWQAQHHYPNSTPATPESVTVAMAEGSGYKLGDSTSAGLIIGPPSATTVDVTTSGNARPVHAVLDSMTEQPSRSAHSSTPNVPTPVVTIQSVDSVIPQGEPATFVVQASAASASVLTVNLSQGGTATGNDVVTPPTSVTVPAGATSATVAVQTRLNNTVESSQPSSCRCQAVRATPLVPRFGPNHHHQQQRADAPDHGCHHRQRRGLCHADGDGQSGSTSEHPSRPATVGQCHGGHRLQPGQPGP